MDNSSFIVLNEILKKERFFNLENSLSVLANCYIDCIILAFYDCCREKIKIEQIIKTVAKIRKKAIGKIKAKETRRRNKVEITKLERKLSGNLYLKYKKETKGMSISKRIEYLKK